MKNCFAPTGVALLLREALPEIEAGPITSSGWEIKQVATGLKASSKSQPMPVLPRVRWQSSSFIEIQS